MKEILFITMISAITFLAGCANSQVQNTTPATRDIQQIPGLVAFWDFKEATDGGWLSQGPEKYTLLPATAIQTVAEGPVSGKSIKLDGLKDYLYIPNRQTGSLNMKDNQVTVVAWVKWSGEKTGFVAGKWNEYEDGGKREYGLFVSLPYYNGLNKVCGHISQKGGPTPPFPYSIDYSASVQDVPATAWACIGFTYDGSYIKSYVNGVFKTSQPELIQHTAGFLADKPEGLVQVKNPYYFTEGIGNNGSDFTVGAVRLKSGMGNLFKGLIGGVAVFNKVLDEKAMRTIAGLYAVKD